MAFHRLSRRSYPHVPAPAAEQRHGTTDPPAVQRVGFRPEDIDAALGALDETFDIDRSDLERLLRQVELQAMVRTHRTLLCADIMSRDVVSVPEHDTRPIRRDSNSSTTTSAPCRWSTPRQGWSAPSACAN